MPKFIKFISNNGLVIINTEEIISFYFSKTSLQICMKLKSDGTNALDYKTPKDFKQQCDAIMEQLEI